MKVLVGRALLGKHGKQLTTSTKSFGMLRKSEELWRKKLINNEK